MSIGGGHIFDMISKMKTNLGVLKRKRFFKNAPRFTDKSFTSNLKRRPLTEKEKKAIQIRVSAENRSNMIRSVIALVLATVIVGISLYFFLIVFN